MRNNSEISVPALCDNQVYCCFKNDWNPYTREKSIKKGKRTPLILLRSTLPLLQGRGDVERSIERNRTLVKGLSLLDQEGSAVLRCEALL